MCIFTKVAISHERAGAFQMDDNPPERVQKLIDAYFGEPRERYAEVVLEVRNNGGLTSSEVKALKDRLLFVHSDTIVRQAGLYDSGKLKRD
jgi:hypothetical protein